MSRKLFLNLPVKDLNKSIDFFTQLGFDFDPTFTDTNGTCMILNDGAFVMLLVEDFFETFIKKELSDATQTTEAIIALSADSKEEVDELVNKALLAGGRPSNDPTDENSMYAWSFQDLDGHLWEVFYMGPQASEQ